MTTSSLGRNTLRNSIETILNFENRDAFLEEDQWSTVWSTTHVPGMDNATGVHGGRRVIGRRKLRCSALVLGGLLTMHCRVTASALTGGLVIFMAVLVLAVGVLANPLRHFEVYLGQWSVSGPGRAFRIIPVFDGIGLAICINAIIRAINCCAIAAIAAVYVMHSVADAKLPFTYCRDFEFKPYDPILRDFKLLMLQGARFSMETGIDGELEQTTITTTVGLNPYGWRNLTRALKSENAEKMKAPRQIAMCKENYTGVYPPLYSTPAYNFFYVEVVKFRSSDMHGEYNTTLCLFIGLVWGIIWLLLIVERLKYHRLIWNNIATWLVAIPCIWVILLGVTAGCSLALMHQSLKKVFKIGAKEIMAAIGDALEVALYIHSSGVGTEIIHGKGLNYYASGHIDSQLNEDNVLHSVFVLLLSLLHSISAAVCALVDCVQPKPGYNMHESTLWIIPMYSKCTSMISYSHLMSTLIFGGLMFSYTTVAFLLIKTALHTIFEYRVKLVFVEQVVVGTLILTCLMLSLVFATSGGLALLESIDAVITGVGMAFVCLLELGGLIYIYRSRDFMSDINVATEDNTCGSRIATQWHIIPFVTLITLLMKSILMFQAEMPTQSMYVALAPLVAVALAVPLRAAHNSYVFLKPTPRLGT